MMKRWPVVLGWLVSGALLSALGCGSGQETETETPVEKACADYCDAAAKVGCPKAGTCQSDCVALGDLGCESSLIDLLACLAETVTPDCRALEGGKAACGVPLADFDNCVPAMIAGPDATCDPSTGASQFLACTGSLKCDTVDFEVACDETGQCDCRVNGKTVGTCTNPIASAYFCAPHAGCCTAFF